MLKTGNVAVEALNAARLVNMLSTSYLLMSTSTDKPYCNGQWTEARFKGFVVSALRRASSRWAPKYTCKKNARTGRNQYVCASCKAVVGNKDIKIDHIEPVVDPALGFQGYDQFVKRLFVELDGYQAICVPCHQLKTNQEKELRNEAKRNKS